MIEKTSVTSVVTVAAYCCAQNSEFIVGFQMDSVFNLRRPYDLVAFMRQEERAHMLGNLKKELLNRKNEIDRHEDRDSGRGCLLL